MSPQLSSEALGTLSYGSRSDHCHRSEDCQQFLQGAGQAWSFSICGLALPGPHMSAPSSAHCLSEMWEARESMMSSSSCWLSERSVGNLETCGS